MPCRGVCIVSLLLSMECLGACCIVVGQEDVKREVQKKCRSWSWVTVCAPGTSPGWHSCCLSGCRLPGCCSLCSLLAALCSAPAPLTGRLQHRGHCAAVSSRIGRAPSRRFLRTARGLVDGGGGRRWLLEVRAEPDGMGRRGCGRWAAIGRQWVGVVRGA